MKSSENKNTVKNVLLLAGAMLAVAFTLFNGFVIARSDSKTPKPKPDYHNRLYPQSSDEPIQTYGGVL